MHEDLILHTPGRIRGQPGALGMIKGGDPFDETDGTDGDQILLVCRLGIVLLGGLMPAGRT